MFWQLATLWKIIWYYSLSVLWIILLWSVTEVRKLYCVPIEVNSAFWTWIVRLCNSDQVDSSSLLTLPIYCSVICAWSQGNVIMFGFKEIICVWKSKSLDLCQSVKQGTSKILWLGSIRHFYKSYKKCLYTLSILALETLCIGKSL